MKLCPRRQIGRPGGDVKGFLIFLVVWFIVAQFILPRFGLRPG